MDGVPQHKLNKIPGGGMPLAQRDKHVGDLTKLTRCELFEIKDREGKLLANKSKLQRLPDKGQRIQVFYEKVISELDRRANVIEAAALFSELNITTKGEKALNRLEWSGHWDGKEALKVTDPTEDVLDSDDESEMDPLRIIAQRTMHERQVRVLPPEPQLITATDLAEIASFKVDSPDSGLSHEDSNNNSTADNTTAVDAEIIAIDVRDKLVSIKPKLQQKLSKHSSSGVREDDSRASTPAQQEMDQHSRYLVHKTEDDVVPQREKFKPYKTTVSNVHEPEKERMRKKGKHWEVTAATPPFLRHDGTKLLTLRDSVEIQANYLNNLKDLQEKQAAERLAARLERLEKCNLQLPPSEELKTKTAFTVYRESVHHIEGKQRFNEDDQVNDPLDEEQPGGGVTYTVYMND